MAELFLYSFFARFRDLYFFTNTDDRPSSQLEKFNLTCDIRGCFIAGCSVQTALCSKLDFINDITLIIETAGHSRALCQGITTDVSKNMQEQGVNHVACRPANK